MWLGPQWPHPMIATFTFSSVVVAIIRDLAMPESVSPYMGRLCKHNFTALPRFTLSIEWRLRGRKSIWHPALWKFANLPVRYVNLPARMSYRHDDPMSGGAQNTRGAPQGHDFEQGPLGVSRCACP